MQKLSALHFLPTGHGNAPGVHENALWQFTHCAPAPHNVPSSTLPSQSASRQLHASGSIGCVVVHVGTPLMHTVFSHVVPLPHLQQFGPVQVGLGSQTQSSSNTPSQSPPTRPHVLPAVPGCALHDTTPFMHTVMPVPQLLEHGDGL